MVSVLVLGGTGMLGSTLLAHLPAADIDTIGTARDPDAMPEAFRGGRRRFAVGETALNEVLSGLEAGDVVVNCIGVIKHNLDGSDPVDRLRAIEVNAVFPHELAVAAAERGLRIIQIATDCVYDGARGGYDELAPHNAIDVYGQTKSLGEVPARGFLNLRCSIIGPELSGGRSLQAWVLSHAAGSSFNGFTNHRWNGVTTHAFARIVAGIVRTGNPLAGTHHLIPADSVDKCKLSRMILAAHGRDDVDVIPITTAYPIDRTLATIDPSVSARLWADAGYDVPPTIGAMVRDAAGIHEPTRKSK